VSASSLYALRLSTADLHRPAVAALAHATFESNAAAFHHAAYAASDQHIASFYAGSAHHFYRPTNVR
jgi:hypothetical protein